VRLTKETHLCHVVILTSNTVFIERIYNDARMKLTSEFRKIDHLSFEKVREWLLQEGLKEKEIRLVWEYLGGSIALILKMLSNLRRGEELKEFLEREAWLAYTEIVDYIARGGFTDKEVELFKKVGEEILERGYFEFREDRREYLPVIEAWAEKEILFYDPFELRVTANSKIYAKGLEILLKRNRIQRKV